MIAKLLRGGAVNFFFASAPIKRVGREAVADLPNINFPTKPKPAEDERLSLDFAADTLNYLRKDRLPNCRYFAVEYESRIYHFYNAYYYPLGRMMNRISEAIRGKNCPHYKNSRAEVKNGDVCVIVNIEDPLVTGKKLLFQKLRYHTGFVGHLREYSYKHVLNHKPELLYHYLLRKVMPKNKLSVKYMENVILCRGPTHNFSSIPQFAPDKKVYQYLPDADLYEIVKNDPSYKLMSESSPGAAEKMLGRKVDPMIDERTREQLRRESDEVIEDLTQIHQDLPKYKDIPTISEHQYDVLKRKEERIEERYRTVRAPYKDKKNKKKIEVFYSEKKARRHPNYELLKNEDLQQIDEEFTAANPHVVGGAVQTPKEPEQPKK